jgi:class 3 adenylate cyclase/CheY-like chemotaxis protein
MDAALTVLAVDDQSINLRLLDAVLTPRGHRMLTATSGADALAMLGNEDVGPGVDVVLLDVLMPGMDGHEVCRRIRSAPATEFLPVVMITASGSEQRLVALQSGADDFITKPFDQAELLARVASLARIKRYHDTIRRQADELARWNDELEARVKSQLAELERTNRLRHFLSPQLADLVVGDENLLRSHRREIVVFFADLRNFTPFAQNSEPEEVMGVLAEYHREMGALVHGYGATLERFTGDGIMAFFNDPIQCDDPAERAVGMALDIREAVRGLALGWHRRGHDLAVGMGIAQGFATLGRIGFEGRYDYSAIGSVTNLAARLCGEAGPWQVLVTDRVLAAVEPTITSELVGDLQLKGFSRPVRVHDVIGRRDVTGRHDAIGGHDDRVGDTT